MSHANNQGWQRVNPSQPIRIDIMNRAVDRLNVAYYEYKLTARLQLGAAQQDTLSRNESSTYSARAGYEKVHVVVQADGYETTKITITPTKAVAQITLQVIAGAGNKLILGNRKDVKVRH